MVLKKVCAGFPFYEKYACGGVMLIFYYKEINYFVENTLSNARNCACSPKAARLDKTSRSLMMNIAVGFF